MATKTELEAKIAALEAEKMDLQAQVANQGAVLNNASGDGWLITTPNPAYKGVTAGVRFENGRAFIPAALKDAKQIVKILTLDFDYEAVELKSGEEIPADARPTPATNKQEKIAQKIAVPAPR